MTKKITPQRVFDAAWQAFVVEGKPPAQEQDPEDGIWECKYLTNDGRRCAFGFLMTAEDARVNEGASASDIILTGKKLDGPERQFDALQFDLHDLMCDEGQWSADFDTPDKRATHYRAVAAEFGFRVPGEE